MKLLIYSTVFLECVQDWVNEQIHELELGIQRCHLPALKELTPRGGERLVRKCIVRSTTVQVLAKAQSERRTLGSQEGRNRTRKRRVEWGLVGCAGV